MRGYQQPAVQSQVTEPQGAFRGLSRHRRSKIASAAQTTLVKADQWARGGNVRSDLSASLEAGLKALQSKAKSG